MFENESLISRTLGFVYDTSSFLLIAAITAAICVFVPGIVGIAAVALLPDGSPAHYFAMQGLHWLCAFQQVLLGVCVLSLVTLAFTVVVGYTYERLCGVFSR